MLITSTTKTDSSLPETEEVPFSDGYYAPVTKTLVVPSVMRYFEEVRPPVDNRNRRTEWNDFEHYKLETTPVQLPVRLECWLQNVWGPPTNNSWVGRPASPYMFYNNSMYGEAGRLSLGLLSLYNKQADGSFVLPPADLENLKQRSLTAMLPIIKAELSLANSVLELKDFISLPRTILAVSNLPGLFSGLARDFRVPTFGLRTTRKSLKEWFRAGADTYLQAKFNVLPLLSDIAGFRRALLRTERRMNDFITRAGRVQKKHFAVFLQEGPAQTYDTRRDGVTIYSLDGDAVNCDVVTERSSYLGATTFHAEIEYNYNYTQYQIEHARILSLLDAVGLNFNLATIWNAIPWSFVVDWVIGLGQWLNRQHVGFMDPLINIYRYLWSVKRTRRISLQRHSITSQYGYGGYPFSTSPTVPAPSIRETAYRRVVGIPEASSIQLSGLNLNEFSLGSALVIARRHHPKYRPSWAYNYVFPG